MTEKKQRRSTSATKSYMQKADALSIVNLRVMLPAHRVNYYICMAEYERARHYGEIVADSADKDRWRLIANSNKAQPLSPDAARTLADGFSDKKKGEAALKQYHEHVREMLRLDMEAMTAEQSGNEDKALRLAAAAVAQSYYVKAAKTCLQMGEFIDFGEI